MEADPDLVKEVHGLDIDDLRGHKKRMMQHNRDLSAATRSKAATYDQGQRGSKGKRDVSKRDNAKQRATDTTQALTTPTRSPGWQGERRGASRATSVTRWATAHSSVPRRSA